MIVVVLFALSALVGTLVMIVAAAVLLPWPTRFTLKLYRTIVAIVQRSWLTLAVALIELMGRVQVTVSGTLQPPSSERATIIICNHHCRVDWLFLWCLCARMRWLRALTIMLKGPLKKVPLFGWACQAFHFIFLSRNDRQGDLSTIEQVCQHLVALGGDPPVVLCFPEGTDLSPENVARSKTFAASKGLPVMEHLLNPRTAGFASTVRALGAQLDAVYDVTITYTSHEAMGSKWGADPRPNEKAIFMNGYWPIHHANVFARVATDPRTDTCPITPPNNTPHKKPDDRTTAKTLRPMVSASRDGVLVVGSLASRSPAALSRR
jgi:lysocardiolipin and lysophospholipid acyltransferase